MLLRKNLAILGFLFLAFASISISAMYMEEDRALNMSLNYRSIPLIKSLMSVTGANPSGKVKRGVYNHEEYFTTSLHTAMQTSNINIIKELLLCRDKLDINAKNSNGATPIFDLLVSWNQSADEKIEIMSLFSSYKADFSITNKLGANLLHHIFFNWEQKSNPFKIVKFLIEKGVDVNEQDSTYGDTPMHILANSNRIPHEKYDFGELKKVVSLFRANGAKFDITNHEGKTAHQTSIELSQRKKLFRYAVFCDFSDLFKCANSSE